ncbi:MAG: putative leader peptide [Actinophytocola sp.]|uniref:putative leader peptide n=1 Tax=Actinophytocola sp. TaxID=1872138 RepID=UPI003D6B32BD
MARPNPHEARHVVSRCGWRWTDQWTRGTLNHMQAATEVLLVARRHVDLVRVSSAMCRPSR